MFVKIGTKIKKKLEGWSVNKIVKNNVKNQLKTKWQGIDMNVEAKDDKCCLVFLFTGIGFSAPRKSQMKRKYIYRLSPVFLSRDKFQY